jgi:predicted ribosome quality control (RQC) complex YloA/Tae2 family protein
LQNREKMRETQIYFADLDKEITFYIGTNARDNFAVIDEGEPNDLWFHAEQVSSCHVIAVIPGDEMLTKKTMEQIIMQGCLLCKENTHKLKTEKNARFIYTTLSNIKKTKTPGEVITRNVKCIKI